MNNHNRIDTDDITASVRVPDIFTRGCSNNTVIFTADGGNHFTDYGIYEGMFLFFDLDKSFLEGRLSCFKNEQDDSNPKYRVSHKPLDGYSHLGRLVMTLRNYEAECHG